MPGAATISTQGHAKKTIKPGPRTRAAIQAVQAKVARRSPNSAETSAGPQSASSIPREFVNPSHLLRSPYVSRHPCLCSGVEFEGGGSKWSSEVVFDHSYHQPSDIFEPCSKPHATKLLGHTTYTSFVPCLCMTVYKISLRKSSCSAIEGLDLPSHHPLDIFPGHYRSNCLLLGIRHDGTKTGELFSWLLGFCTLLQVILILVLSARAVYVTLHVCFGADHTIKADGPYCHDV